MIIWLAIVLAVLALGFTYLNARLIGTMGRSSRWKRGARVCLAAVFLVPLLSMILSQFIQGLGVAWAWVVYVDLGVLSLVFTLVIARDILLLVFKGYELIASLFFRTRNDTQPDQSRRAFLVQSSNLAILGLAGALTAYGVYQARRRPGIAEITVPLQRLPEAFEGFRIVQITDIHAGLTVRRDWIETVARQVQDLKPDLIALTGDLADGSVKQLRDDVAPLRGAGSTCGKVLCHWES